MWHARGGGSGLYGGRTTVSIGVIWRMVKDDRGEDLGIEEVEDFSASAYDRK